MSRLQTRFTALKEQNRAALVTFVTAGDPDYDTSLATEQVALERGTVHLLVEPALQLAADADHNKAADGFCWSMPWPAGLAR